MTIRKENPFWRAASIMQEYANCQDKARAQRELHMAMINYSRYGRKQDVMVFKKIQEAFRLYKNGR